MATEPKTRAAAPAEAPAAPTTLPTPDAPVSGAFTFTLTKKIKAHGEDISVLNIREPSGKDIIEFGNPVRVDLQMNERTMQAQIVNLCAVPPSSVAQMSARDWNTLAFEMLARFFHPDLSGEQVTLTKV